MINLTVESAVPAENASRLQQVLGKPEDGFPTATTASTTSINTRYSWCPPKRDNSIFPLRDFAFSYWLNQGNRQQTAHLPSVTLFALFL